MAEELNKKLIEELKAPFVDFLKEEHFCNNLVKQMHLRFDGSTGVKQVKAYFNIFQGQLQVTFKYGKEFYRFNVVEATEDQRKYAETHNIKA